MIHSLESIFEQCSPVPKLDDLPCLYCRSLLVLMIFTAHSHLYSTSSRSYCTQFIQGERGSRPKMSKKQKIKQLQSADGESELCVIQDSSGNAGLDDLRHNARGSPHNENYLGQERPQSQTVFTNRANVNFQIAVALACLLDIRISYIYASSCIRLGTKL